MALDDIRSDRLNKLEKIRAMGVDPYPAKTERSQEIGQVLSEIEAGKAPKGICIAGRIRSFRSFGAIAFADLEDESGKLQLFFMADNLSTPPFDIEFLKLLDIGDFIEAGGFIDKTKTGQDALFVTNFKLLTKTILPLPTEFYGLKDIEERYRKRYLDLLMNPKSKDTFAKRAKIIQAVRKFFTEEKGYLEMENPVLQPLYGGTRARPFVTHHNTLDTDLYLRISNELYLKRLVVGGFEKIFEIGHTFRNEGMDRNHNPEFTMLETMHTYIDYMDNMDLFEEMFEYVCMQVFGTTQIQYQGTTLDFKRPWQRVKLTDLFKTHTNIDFHSIESREHALTIAKQLGVSVQDYMTDSELLLEIFEKKCTDQLIQPTFVYDYPADFYPLAKRKADNPNFVESFDVYCAGMEMGTNYTEQNDPEQIRQAWLAEKAKLDAGNPETQILDEAFLEALEYGMPPTSGIGAGLDRWVMVLTDSTSISDVIPFPTMKAEN